MISVKWGRVGKGVKKVGGAIKSVGEKAAKAAKKAALAAAKAACHASLTAFALVHHCPLATLASFLLLLALTLTILCSL